MCGADETVVLDAAGKLGKIVVGMNRALGDIPVTVKLRSGVKDGKNTAHKLMPRLGPDFGVSAITVGRFAAFSDPDMLILVTRCRSYTVGRDSSGTPSLLTGTISSSASMQCACVSRTRAVRFIPPPHLHTWLDMCCSRPHPDLWWR